MNRKRQKWVEFCTLCAVIWAIVGVVFFWPAIILAALSALLILLPVGIRTDEPPVERARDAWRTDQKRPWR